MTRYGLSVCGAHGGYAAAARMSLRRAMLIVLWVIMVLLGFAGIRVPTPFSRRCLTTLPPHRRSVPAAETETAPVCAGAVFSSR